MLADIRKKLAVKLADTWLLFDNSQVPRKLLIYNTKPRADRQKINQQ